LEEPGEGTVKMRFIHPHCNLTSDLRDWQRVGWALDARDHHPTMQRTKDDHCEWCVGRRFDLQISDSLELQTHSD
jgi:hypothetical protein